MALRAGGGVKGARDEVSETGHLRYTCIWIPAAPRKAARNCRGPEGELAMKRALQIVGVLVLLLAVAGTLIGSAFIGRQAITDGFEVGGVRIVKDGIVTIGVISTGDKEVALIDAGNDPSGKAILAELARRHLGRKRSRRSC